ncbi:Uncharacterised protein [Serratia marcescens]|nr:Uncharacterised protein [Serratia marcescens]
MIDKYLLEDLSLRSDEKGELARWVIQLQADVDTERRKSASLESVIYARDTHIAELEVIRTDAAQVFKEIGYDLGCNPDNESIMMAIDDLKKDNTSLRYQRAGLAREANELEAQAKVWESAATKHLERAEEAEKRLATPVRLPDIRQSSSGDRYQWSDGAHNYRLDVISMLLGAGFTVAVEGVE